MYEPKRPLATLYLKTGSVFSSRLIRITFDKSGDVSGYELEGITVSPSVIDIITIDYGNTEEEAE